MSSGDIITWVLFAIIMFFFAIGLKHIYKNFVRGESDCCANGTCPACAECAKEETTKQERENAAKAWAAIRAEAREKRNASCPHCAPRKEPEKKYACPACEARAKAAEAKAAAAGK